MNANNPTRSPRRTGALKVLAVAIAAAALSGGCGGDSSGRTQPDGRTKIRVGYIGLTCEAPLFVALEKGFFDEEGLDVEMVRCEWATYKDALALGRYDVTHHLVMYFLKPIEQGMDVKFTGGVHRGCLRVQAGVNGDIRTVQDLRGKTIGVPGMGTPPFMLASRALAAGGVDPSREVRWRVYPAGELGLAMDRGLVDAVATSEPIGSLLLESGKVRNVVDQATDPPYSEEYCCAVLVNGKFLERYPEASAAATRAILKAAKWVDANPTAAAVLSVESRFIASTPELNAYAISNLSYVPSVIGAEQAVVSAAGEMKLGGMLEEHTDVHALARRSFVHLHGVDDHWLDTVAVNDEPDEGLLGSPDIAALMQAMKITPLPGCCRGAMY
jgi:NitT/TauT family transport system substrate-binding protein